MTLMLVLIVRDPGGNKTKNNKKTKGLKSLKCNTRDSSKGY